MNPSSNVPFRRKKSASTVPPAKMTPPKPTPPPFSFSSTNDTPKGVKYVATELGFQVSAAARSIPIAILFAATMIALGFLIWKGWEAGERSGSFYVVLGLALAFSLFASIFFVAGREGLELNGNRLRVRKTIFGLGLSTKLPLDKIERVRVFKRAGARMLGGYFRTPRFYTYAAWGPTVNVNDEVLEIETDKVIKKLGTRLRSQHLYYFRYLIIEKLRDFHAGKASPSQF